MVDAAIDRCRECGGTLDVIYDADAEPALSGRGLWRYFDLLPQGSNACNPDGAQRCA